MKLLVALLVLAFALGTLSGGLLLGLAAVAGLLFGLLVLLVAMGEVLRRNPDSAARLFAWGHSRSDRFLERHYGEDRHRLLSGLRGRVLEIGPGTGNNLPHYPSEVSWVGVEPNVHMHHRLRARARALGRQVELHLGSAEALPFPAQSFDAVVATLVLCSVADQDAALREVRRVLRPGGRFLFLEHVGAPRSSGLRLVQELVAPLWSSLGHGCRPDRETGEALERAGFAALDFRRQEKSGLSLVVHHVVGEARMAGDSQAGLSAAGGPPPGRPG